MMVLRSLRLAGVAALAVVGLVLAGPATSSYAATGANFVATGHDMDYHCATGTPEECEYLKIVVDKVRAGSSLPILALDQGSEVPDALAITGYTGAGEVVTVNPADATAFNATAFVDGAGHPLYSAIITASDGTCGGCDNNLEGEANINARAADFKAYFNAGGGILALAGAQNFETYYGFVPLNVAATAVEPPFTVTSEGAALGVNEEMANCCATHNSFSVPPSPLVVLETDSAEKAETIGAFGVAIGERGFTAPVEETKTPVVVKTTPAPTIATPPAATGVKAIVKASKKQCRSARSVTVHWQTRSGVSLSQVVITLNGKRYKKLGGSARKASINFAGRGRGAVTMKILGTADGARYVSTRIFHPCVPAAENSNVRTLVLRRL
jgi:hypothetical protein